MIVSFITPIYNEENYLPELFESINKNYNDYNFEWIFIDDNSTDKSYELIKDFLKTRNKIKLFKNNGKGKIDAINHAFKHTSGKFIKLVGGDDKFDLKIIDNIKNDQKNCSYVHNAKIIDEKGNHLGSYIPPYQLFSYSKDNYFLENISCPSWCWVFPREVAENFFPIPDCEYEDLYLSFCIRKFTQVKYINDFFYFYRQNPGQTFGNILLYDNQIGLFRSKRSLKSITKIKNHNIFNLREKFLLSRSREYYILYIKKKNIRHILFSRLSKQRKTKLIIFRYFYKAYGIFQKIKYTYDKFYHEYKKKHNSKNEFDTNNLINENKNLEIKNKKIIFLKSCLSYPSTDGLTQQYYSFLDYLSKNNDCKAYLFCKDDFEKDNFLKHYKDLKDVEFLSDYPEKFSIFLPKIFFLVLAYKMKLKKVKLFDELENFSTNSDYKFYFHDIIFYPLLLLNIDKNKIIFSITDFQTNRLMKLIFTSKNFFKSIYYLTGFIHCLIIESFVFKKVSKVHVYSLTDRKLLEKIFFYKNLISIPNFNTLERKKNVILENKYIKNLNKILIMGDLNQIEHMKGLIQFKKLKFFSKYEKRYNFVFRGNYNASVKKTISDGFTNCEFSTDWVDESDYLSYLDSYKILLFLDSIEFGLSNRVADALKSSSLMVGFKAAFTGYSIKNFKEAIFLNSFLDFVQAFNFNENQKKEIEDNATAKSLNFTLNAVKSKWNDIL